MKYSNTPKKGIWVSAIMLILVSLLAACIANPGTNVEPNSDENMILISGQILATDETSETLLPVGNLITVQIQDTSRADAPAIILAAQIINGATSLPTSYQIKVSREDLEKTFQASLSVRIEDAEGKLLFITDTIYPVTMTQTTIDISVIAVVSDNDISLLPPAFEGQVWQWLAFEDSADGEESNDITVDDPAGYTLELLADGTYAVQADCNNGNGQFILNQGGLTLVPGVMTLAECGPESVSDRFISLLGDVVTYVFDSEGNLVLNLKIDAGNMIFKQSQSNEEVDSNSTLLESSDLWRGIGRINIDSTCTAVLIDTGAGDEAPAFILTNGHCLEWQANGTITNQEVEGDVLFNYYADAPEEVIAIPLAEVVYSTMQGIDITILRLDATLGDLAKLEIHPYPIAEAALEPGSKVRVVGAPSSGLEESEAYLREEICQIREQVDLIEFNWHFYDHYATDCQDIFGGSSGSPLFAIDNNTIYGLINTTVDGSSACYLGVPCEISSDGSVLNPGTSYASPIQGLNDCFDDTGNFALSNTCPLPPTSQLDIEEGPHSPSQPPLTWSTTLAGDLPFYRYKTGAASIVDCRSEEGYSAAISLAKNPTIDDVIPNEEGFYLLCVLAGKSAVIDQTWQNPAYPTVEIAQIDTTPPQLEPQLGIMEMPEFYDVSLIFSPPELSAYLYKFGPPETTDCSLEDGYENYRRIAVSLERGGGPIRLCVIGFDNANNATAPLDKVFDD